MTGLRTGRPRRFRPSGIGKSLSFTSHRRQ